VITVGLTGGIGSGKTEVARMLAERGAVVVDADALAREAVEPRTPGLAAVLEEFGPDVLAADGSLDRSRLGEVVFADPARREALEATAAAPADAVVVYDVPLLVEKHLQGRYDVVVVVDVAVETQVRRLAAARGMTEAEARARIAAQASREDRLAVADRVLVNEGDLADLRRSVAGLWQELASRRGTGV